MGHGHVEHLLELASILSDGDMARRGETILLYHFAPSTDRTECHETFIFKILNSFGELLFLLFTELLLGQLDGVAGMNFRMEVTFFGFGSIGFTDFSHVDVVVHDVVVDVDDRSHQACQEVC